MTKKILFITTNYSGCNCDEKICECIKDTGVFLKEFAQPYLIFEKTGYDIEIASIKGGLSPVDETSMSCSNPMEWDNCIKILRNTKKLSDIKRDEFDVLYFPGGHGPLFDIAENTEIKEIVEYFYKENKIISAICHGVCALINAKYNNEPILKGKRVTSFTNKEEKIVKLDNYVPFLLQTKLEELGADFIEFKPWDEHVEVDNNIITGQNQNSAVLISEKIIEVLNK